MLIGSIREEKKTAYHAEIKGSTITTTFFLFVKTNDTVQLQSHSQTFILRFEWNYNQKREWDIVNSLKTFFLFQFKINSNYSCLIFGLICRITKCFNN